MKTNAMTISTGNIHDPELEKMLQKKDAELKEAARRNAKHFALRNLPGDKDNIIPYIGELNTGYEELAAEAFQRLQPAAHFPEARMDADYFRERDKHLENEIKVKENKNINDSHELGDFTDSNIPARIRIAFIAAFFITAGEILYNTKAFQITGESMLFALFISICISVAVLVFSNIVPRLYRRAKDDFQRKSVIGATLGIATAVFTALSIMRTEYLVRHDMHVNSIIFVIINIFLFIVATLTSYFIMPSRAEIEQNSYKIKTLHAFNRRKKEIELLKAEREKIKEIILERTKLRFRIAHQANYIADRIRKMYYEAVEIFKTTNLVYRTDGLAPKCFSEKPPEPDIDDFNYTVITPVNE